jgi:Flp pilus assembly pilin Flp
VVYTVEVMYSTGDDEAAAVEVGVLPGISVALTGQTVV